MPNAQWYIFIVSVVMVIHIKISRSIKTKFSRWFQHRSGWMCNWNGINCVTFFIFLLIRSSQNEKFKHLLNVKNKIPLCKVGEYLKINGNTTKRMKLPIEHIISVQNDILKKETHTQIKHVKAFAWVNSFVVIQIQLSIYKIVSFNNFTACKKMIFFS